LDSRAVGIPHARTPMTRITGTAMLFPTVPWTTWDCNDKTVGLTHDTVVAMAITDPDHLRGRMYGCASH
ncbi:MAG: hypothetical protein Q613_PSC00167G0001, partial [Propionibacterium sp. DORA_15]